MYTTVHVKRMYYHIEFGYKKIELIKLYNIVYFINFKRCQNIF